MSVAAKFSQLNEELIALKTSLTASTAQFSTLSEPVLSHMAELSMTGTTDIPNLMSGNLETYLRLQNVVDLMKENVSSIKASFGSIVANTGGPQVSASDRLGQALEEATAAFDVKTKPDWQDFQVLLTDLGFSVENDDENDADIVMTKQKESFICPISLKQYENPHKRYVLVLCLDAVTPLSQLTSVSFNSKSCGHSYSLEAIKSLAGSSRSVMCPISGCTDPVVIAALTPDVSLMRRMKFNHASASSRKTAI